MERLIGDYGPFLLALTTAILGAILTFWLSKKSGLQPAQSSLIKTLQDNVNAYSDRVSLLEESLNQERNHRIKLEEQVNELTQNLLSLVQENERLKRQVAAAP